MSRASRCHATRPGLRDQGTVFPRSVSAERRRLYFSRASEFNRGSVSKTIAPPESTLFPSSLRQVFVWCLPALLLGAALRVSLMVQMPHAFFHDDSPDFLQTPERLLHEGKFDIHAKKTFLTPIVFTVPFLLPAPPLVTISLFQHVLGLVLVFVVGGLGRLWFQHWKWFIIPITLLTAANPFMLWYEHTIMAETLFVFCTALVAFAGTLYCLDRSAALGRASRRNAQRLKEESRSRKAAFPRGAPPLRRRGQCIER